MSGGDATAMDAAEAVAIAAAAKTKVMRGGVRAACGLSVREVVAMARVLDCLLVDAVFEPRWKTPAADQPPPRPVSEL